MKKTTPLAINPIVAKKYLNQYQRKTKSNKQTAAKKPRKIIKDNGIKLIVTISFR